MGNRLSRIVTRTGDGGTTGLADGNRVAKDSARVEALGDVDELNSHVGLLLAELTVTNAAAVLPPAMGDVLLRIQHDLFDLGGELSLPGRKLIDETHVEALERDVTALNEALPPLKEFILPGGSRAAAQCHVARTVARRAERRCWTLNQAEPLNPLTLAYLNRLSDLLFVLSRVIARSGGGSEVLWDRKRFV